ncbi:hypothetical protein Q8A57_01765 [Porticoccus litoralis]|uniref:Secreted protein n=1 Tax=Porticoccus litoralis TaxID=434086 RepID=A0AAW8B2D5_9GAMM|nr:hypothetical protein [Porticoccus litoralis]MDP1519694.1 hypothetical protein [Porticoccus litoralis]
MKSISWGILFFIAAMSSAHAAVTITIVEDSGNVVATAEGTLNLDALTSSGSSTLNPAAGVISGEKLSPTSTGEIFFGGASPVTHWQIEANEPAFSTSYRQITPIASGTVIGVRTDTRDGQDRLYTRTDYDSEAPISATATWEAKTFADMELIPGIYVYSWGEGSTADSLTIKIGVITFPPEPEVPPYAETAGHADTATLAEHADTATYSETAGHAETAAQADVADQLSITCNAGQILAYDNGNWICTNEAPYAGSAGSAGEAETALEALSLADSICTDGQILAKESGTWVCADIKAKDKSRSADVAKEAEVAKSLSPETCMDGDVLLKESGEWQCTNLSQATGSGIPFFSKGIAIRPNHTNSLGLQLFNQPNESSDCCYTDIRKSNVILPRGGVLSSLTVRPIGPPIDHTEVEVVLWVNNSRTSLSVQHIADSDGNVATYNDSERVEVSPGDLLSVGLVEEGRACGFVFGSVQGNFARFEFLESGLPDIKDHIADNVLPLLIPYDERKRDPAEWAQDWFIEDAEDQLRGLYDQLQAEKDEYFYCGEYSISFILE